MTKHHTIPMSRFRSRLMIVITMLCLVNANAYTYNNHSKRVKTDYSSDDIAQSTSGEKLTIIGVRIDSPRLVEILNYGTVRELNSNPPKLGQNLRLRLYRVPKEGDCVPDTHVVCSSHFYLAVSSFEEGMGESVFDLGEVGEISDIQWVNTDDSQVARLKIVVTNYPPYYFQATKSANKKQKVYELDISIEKLLVKLVAQ